MKIYIMILDYDQMLQGNFLNYHGKIKHYSEL